VRKRRELTEFMLTVLSKNCDGADVGKSLEPKVMVFPTLIAYRNTPLDRGAYGLESGNGQHRNKE